MESQPETSSWVYPCLSEHKSQNLRALPGTRRKKTKRKKREFVISWYRHLHMCKKQKKKNLEELVSFLFKICTWMLSDVWETTCTIFPLSSEWPKRILARENCFQNLTVDIFSTVPLKENLSKNQQQNLNYLFCYAETIYHD